MAAIFWKVHFPVYARSLQSTMRLRVIHVVCVLLALLLPVIPVVATMVHDVVQESNSEQPLLGTLGFGFTLFPPHLCLGLNLNVTFYTIIFPSMLLVIFGTVALILTIRKIHKASSFPLYISTMGPGISGCATLFLVAGGCEPKSCKGWHGMMPSQHNESNDLLVSGQ